MSDLSDLQAAQTIKIAGANPSTGIENFYAEVDSGGRLATAAAIMPLLAAAQTVVALSSSSWAALPATALIGRKSIAIQNQSGPSSVLLLNFTGTGSDGWRVPNNSSRVLSVDATVTVYGRMISGTGSVLVEELA